MKKLNRAAFTMAALGLMVIVTPVSAFQNENTVRIGLLEPQTGTYGPFGLAGAWGTIIAFDEINAAGGVTVDGKKVKISVTPSPSGYDAGSDPAQSITLLKRLLADDQVLMVKGLSNSNSGTAVFNYLAELEKEGNPIVVHSSAVGTPGLTKLSKYAFRNSFAESDVIVTLTKQAQKQTGAKTAGLFVVKDNPYYVAITERSIIPTLKELGIEVVATTDAVGSDRDFSRQANDMRAAKPDLIFIMGPPLSAVTFLKEAKRRQVSPKLLIGNISLMATETLQSGGDAVEGMVFSAGYNPTLKALESFSTEYKKRYGQDINMFSVTAYEAGYLIAKAIETAGISNTQASLSADRVKLRDALAKVTIDSPTGEKVSMNADRETPKAGIALVVKGGRFVPW